MRSLIPLRNAHTDGDTLIHFSNHDILATGDCYRGVGYLYVDLNNGGSLAGILEALGTIIGDSLIGIASSERSTSPRQRLDLLKQPPGTKLITKSLRP